VNYEDVIRAVSVLTTVRISELPQALYEFLLAYGYVRPADIVGFAERVREIDPAVVRGIFVQWIEEQDRVVATNFFAERYPDWAPNLVDDVPDLPGRYYGAIVYLPRQIDVKPRGPSTIVHKIIATGTSNITNMHVISSSAPFVAYAAHKDYVVAVIRSVVTSRSWVQSRIG